MVHYEEAAKQIRQVQSLLGLISHHDPDAPLLPEVVSDVCLTSSRLLDGAAKLINQDG